MGKPAEVEEDAPRGAHGLRDLASPHILPDSEERPKCSARALQLPLLGPLRKEAAGFDAQVLEALADVFIKLRDLEADHVAVLVLADEGDVHEADCPGLDQVGERRSDLTPELVAGKATIKYSTGPISVILTPHASIATAMEACRTVPRRASPGRGESVEPLEGP